jgi:hypothetical protein
VNRLVQQLIQTIKGSNKRRTLCDIAARKFQQYCRYSACTLERLAINHRVAVGSWQRPAKDTLDIATSVGLRFCFTSDRRQNELDRVSEASIKTLKRDYARLSVLPDAGSRSCRAGLGITKVHPQSRMKFLSPRECPSYQRPAQRATCPIERVQTESIRMN